jgi:hypothetical protein
MEKLVLIMSLRKKLGGHINARLKSFKICQNEREIYVELHKNLKAPQIKKSINYCNLLADSDFGKKEFQTTIHLGKEITDNATTLLSISIVQLIPDFPEIFKICPD